jgi:hypothetical protein
MTKKRVKYADTWNGIARAVLPEVPKTPRGNNFLGYLLWNETAFPMADADHVRKQLEEFRNAVKGDVVGAYKAWLKHWHEVQKINRMSYEERRAYFAEQVEVFDERN